MLRRDVLRLAGLVPVAASVGWLAGCDPSVAPDGLQGDGAIDPLLVRTANGLVVLDAATGQVLAGPARSSLRQYATTFANDVLTIAL